MQLSPQPCISWAILRKMPTMACYPLLTPLPLLVVVVSYIALLRNAGRKCGCCSISEDHNWTHGSSSFIALAEKPAEAPADAFEDAAPSSCRCECESAVVCCVRRS